MLDDKYKAWILCLLAVLIPLTVYAYDSSYTGAQVDAEIARSAGRNTTVADPGSDAELVSEQAVREALNLKADLISPTLVTPDIGTPSAGVLTNATGLPGTSITDDSVLEASLDATNAPTDNYILSYDLASTGFTWVASAGGDLKADGTVPLTANWDIGAYTITGTRFISDITTGTAPFGVSSTTVVPNLNVSQLLGQTWAEPGAIGGTTPAAISCTDLTPSGDIDTTGANSFSTGPLIFTSTATPPDADGKVAYLSGVTGLTSKLFSYYSTAVQYMLSYDTLPTVDGSVPTYNAANDDFDWEVPAGSTVASSAEVNTGTDNAKFISPDALAGSNLGTKEVAWTIYDSDTVTAVADGKQFFSVPASMVGMNLIDLTCSVHDLNSASGGTTTVVLRRVRGATAVDMTSTGTTIAYDAYTASDETVDTANDDLALGDRLFPDVNAVTTGAAQKGLSVTALFRLP